MGGIDALVVGAQTEYALNGARLETSRAEGRRALLLMALAVVAAGLRARWLAALVLPSVARREGRRRRRGLVGNAASLVVVPPPRRGAGRAGRRRRRVGLAAVRNAALAFQTPPPGIS